LLNLAEKRGFQTKIGSDSKKYMELVHELESDLALAILLEKKCSEKIEAKEVVSLITRVNETLETVSLKDHSYTEDAPELDFLGNVH